MIQTDAPKQITYGQFGAQVAKVGPAMVALIFTDATGTAHVFPMPDGTAKQIEDGLAKARTGIEIANGNGAPGG